MKIEIIEKNIENTKSLILTDEELDNYNFVDLEFKDNQRGLVGECNVSLEELKCAVDAFWQKKRIVQMKRMPSWSEL